MLNLSLANHDPDVATAVSESFEFGHRLQVLSTIMVFFCRAGHDQNDPAGHGHAPLHVHGPGRGGRLECFHFFEALYSGLEIGVGTTQHRRHALRPSKVTQCLQLRDLCARVCI
jgi:hypothetical protein